MGNVQRVIKDEKAVLELIIWALKVVDLKPDAPPVILTTELIGLQVEGRPLITAAQASMGGL